MFNFKSLFKGKDTHVVSRVSENSGAWFGSGSPVARTQTVQSAMEIAAVSACVKTIAESVASTPLRLMAVKETEAGTTRKVVHNHWASRLMKNPNSYQTPIEFWEMMVAQSVLGKGSLALRTVVNGECRELIPIPAGAWTLEVKSDFDYQFRVQLADGREAVFGKDAVFYLKGLTLDGFSGVSSIEKARKALGVTQALEDQQLALLGNGGRPSGVLTFDQPLTAEQAEAIKAQWQTNFGPNGKGGIAVLDGNSKFQAMQMNQVDSQGIENRKFQVEEIARIFRVPTEFLGLSPVTAETMRTFVQTTLRPHYVRIEQALAKQLLGNNPQFIFDFDELDLLRGDTAGQTAYFQASLGSGGHPSWLAVNEVRHELGLNPIDEEWARKPLRGGYEGANGTPTGEDPE